MNESPSSKPTAARAALGRLLEELLRRDRGEEKQSSDQHEFSVYNGATVMARL